MVFSPTVVTLISTGSSVTAASCTGTLVDARPCTDELSGTDRLSASVPSPGEIIPDVLSPAPGEAIPIFEFDDADEFLSGPMLSVLLSSAWVVLTASRAWMPRSRLTDWFECGGCRGRRFSRMRAGGDTSVDPSTTSSIAGGG